MADITITAASVVPGSDANVIQGTAGETITAGMAVYYNSTTSKWLKAQCDGTAVEAGSGGVGIALTGSSNNQSINVQIAGSVTIGGTVVATTPYIVSATAGGICPYADLASSQYATFLGYASTTGIIVMARNATGVTKA